jgi:hypothetical protein
MRIEKMSVASMESDNALISRICEILKDSYTHPLRILNRDLVKSTDVYLGWHDSGELLGFFFVGWNYPNLLTNNPVYLALSASIEHAKGSGSVLRLYQRFIDDATKEQVKLGKNLLPWCTTVHPLVWRTMHRLFRRVTPSLTGEYNLNEATTASQLCDILGARSDPSGHPFILRNVVTDVNYTETQKIRCEKARDKLQCDIFSKYDIREERGDRVLLLLHL